MPTPSPKSMHNFWGQGPRAEAIHALLASADTMLGDPTLDDERRRKGASVLYRVALERSLAQYWTSQGTDAPTLLRSQLANLWLSHGPTFARETMQVWELLSAMAQPEQEVDHEALGAAGLEARRVTERLLLGDPPERQVRSQR